MCNKRLAALVSLHKAAVKAEPENASAWQSLGVHLRQLGKFPEALEALETASQLAPLTVISRYALADCYVYGGKADLARLLYRMLALEDERATPSVRLAAARSLAFLGELGAAESTAREVCREKPMLAAAYFDLGYYRGRQGAGIAEVEGLARRAIALAPHEDRYRISLANLLAMHDRRTEAWDLVAHVSPEAISKMTCQSCLLRLAELCDWAGDAARGSLARAAALRAPHCTSGEC